MPNPSDKTIVKRAESRSALKVWLTENPGRHSVSDISKATNIIGNAAGRYLQSMADNGEIPQPEIEGTQKFFNIQGEIKAKKGMKKLKAAGKTPAPKTERVTTERTTPTETRRVNGKAVEIAYGGSLIVIDEIKGKSISIGQNNGRIRITLEDVA